MYEINLVDEKTEKLVKCYNSRILPNSADIIILEGKRCFVVGGRILPSGDSNRVVCFGSTTEAGMGYVKTDLSGIS